MQLTFFRVSTPLHTPYLPALGHSLMPAGVLLVFCPKFITVICGRRAGPTVVTRLLPNHKSIIILTLMLYPRVRY